MCGEEAKSAKLEEESLESQEEKAQQPTTTKTGGKEVSAKNCGVKFSQN